MMALVALQGKAGSPIRHGTANRVQRAIAQHRVAGSQDPHPAEGVWVALLVDPFITLKNPK